MELTCDGVKGRDSQQYDDGHINIQSHSNVDKYGSRKYICLWCKGRIGPLSQSTREAVPGGASPSTPPGRAVLHEDVAGAFGCPRGAGGALDQPSPLLPASASWNNLRDHLVQPLLKEEPPAQSLWFKESELNGGAGRAWRPCSYNGP